MQKRGKASGRTSIALQPETKELLEPLKLSDGEESWDHLLGRLGRIAKNAAARGLLDELAA